ncbi:HET-domain-containing protein [Corynespora cassiicola Philippines]|uniref:HET-domain-containing protein n=1 Tax=Corynespora cassiicola Philippines TaxID=1448308 RepID=A0A2T2NID8_CORCC|nr:HET-domain-containing protein [Corynespora cassiicola Philippines]
MRLIHTETKEMRIFEYPDIPRYAILSHTWGDSEISLQDFESNRRDYKTSGWAKLNEGCRIAAESGFDYFWIDTCCIDKTNSVELSEAINSMFYWYQEAAACFAYLSDMPAGTVVSGLDSSFSRSKWFTRGWTLQELLAPSDVIFLAEDWTVIGHRSKLAPLIAEITGISTGFLLGHDLDEASVAMRMSWVSKRKTTKEEDIAYCLLGIFGIHMPLLYGEREFGAFRRLQEEIMKTSDDQSIFAWLQYDNLVPRQNAVKRHTYSIMAYSPALFHNGGNIVQSKAPEVEGYLRGIRTPTVFNNKGLQLSLPTIQKQNRISLAILNCRMTNREEYLAIVLEDVSTNGGRYVRVERDRLIPVHINVILETAKYSDISISKGKFEHQAQKEVMDYSRTSFTEKVSEAPFYNHATASIPTNEPLYEQEFIGNTEFANMIFPEPNAYPYVPDFQLFYGLDRAGREYDSRKDATNFIPDNFPSWPYELTEHDSRQDVTNFILEVQRSVPAAMEDPQIVNTNFVTPSGEPYDLNTLSQSEHQPPVESRYNLRSKRLSR